ncbi:Rab proteins geranylgeranyltransferase component A [Portunus trituberculatus]|uniref:Rab proteins geranylgeranyltransferase component A n=1 Tax=Portunus trituberculatus TaxID=210409 RepID=A0A5B7CGS4_PORTR|nr:Rab proteins geranylgeranyltransferase component A [Portunus trituberculatus]
MGLWDLVTVDLGTEVVGVGVHRMERWVLHPMGGSGLGGKYCWLSVCDLKTNAPGNLYLCPGPNTDLDYDLAIEQARSIFGSMFLGEEFLPRAPDPEEIAFDNQGTEPKQGDTFEGDANSEGKSDGGNGQEKEAEETEQVLEVKEQTEKEQEKGETAKEQDESEVVEEVESEAVIVVVGVSVKRSG